MKLASEDSKHVHTRHGFSLEENLNVVAIDLKADALFVGGRGGLVWSLVEHGGKAKKLSLCRLID